MKHGQHPMQPVIIDQQGVSRFLENKVVNWMFNELARKGTTFNDYPFEVFPTPDLEQFYQLIGYSISGYCDLSMVSDKSKDMAEDKAFRAKVKK